MSDDTIYRQAAIDAVNGMPDCPNGFSGTYDKAAIIGILEDVPSVEELKSEALETAYLEGYTAGQNAQPKYVALHESCTDCPLYDRKNYNCPRFNRVIPMAIRDAQTQVKALSLPSVQPEQSSEIQDILEYLDTVLHPIISPDHWNVYSELHDMISMLPSAQPIDVQEAYYRGKIDGIKECTTRLKKMNEEFANGRHDLQTSGDRCAEPTS